MARAQSQYLKFYTGATNHYLLQSYYVNSTISLDSLSWTYFPFNADGLMQSSAAGGNGVSLTVPATEKAVDIFTIALSREYLVQLKIYEFDSRLSNVAPETSQTLIVDFIGVIKSMSGDFNTLSVELGSNLSPVGAQVPPRKFTSYLIGYPIRI